MAVGVGMFVDVGVGVPAGAGLTETPPMAQWSALPKEALIVTLGLAPSALPPAPIRPPPPAMTFHCCAAGAEKATEVQVSQAKTPRTSSSAPEGIERLGELLSP